MTLLARDEGDIIRQNIEFHYKKGVDFIIATDNASLDNTRDIFLEYRDRGKLYLIEEPGRDYSQAAWINRMAKIAIDRYGADIIFYCDADEFWRPKKGDLKTEIWNSLADVLFVNVINVLLEDHDGNESFPRDAKYAVINPIEASDYLEDTKKDNLYLFKYPPKVMFKTGKGFLEVAHGNHSIVTQDVKFEWQFSSNIDIYHFPLRGKEKFYQKVTYAGKAYEQKVSIPKSQSIHLRRWYDSYQNGSLDLTYQGLTLSKTKAAALINQGMVHHFDFDNFLNS